VRRGNFEWSVAKVLLNSLLNFSTKVAVEAQPLGIRGLEPAPIGGSWAPLEGTAKRT
jgi:hypothetical protein